MRKNLIYSLSLLASLALTTGCGGGQKKAEAAESTETKKVIVTTERAVMQEIDETASFTSSIEAFKQNNIASAAQGLRIDNILVDVGTQVRKGQLLATMDPVNKNNISVQLANAEADYERMKRVYEAGGLSKQQMDQTEAAIEVQRANAKNVLDQTELRSPIDGVVTARNYDPGDYPGQLPILEVMQINTLKVTLSISEKYFPLIKKGMSTEVSVDMYPGRTFEGKVSLIYPAIDPATRTFTIEVTIPNAKGDLRPGMFSRTKLHFGKKQGIMVSDVAIQKQMGTNDKYLFVAKDGIAERRVVLTGTQIDGYIEVLSGVNEGDEVITAGISRLMQGTEITVENK